MPKTIGIVEVACFAAIADGIAANRREHRDPALTSSAASAGSRS